MPLIMKSGRIWVFSTLCRNAQPQHIAPVSICKSFAFDGIRATTTAITIYAYEIKSNDYMRLKNIYVLLLEILFSPYGTSGKSKYVHKAFCGREKCQNRRGRGGRAETASGRNVVYQVQIVKYIRLLSRDIRVSRKWHSIRNIFTFLLRHS